MARYSYVPGVAESSLCFFFYVSCSLRTYFNVSVQSKGLGLFLLRVSYFSVAIFVVLLLSKFTCMVYSCCCY